VKEPTRLLGQVSLHLTSDLIAHRLGCLRVHAEDERLLTALETLQSTIDGGLHLAMLAIRIVRRRATSE
jgi:hypothetical protein